MRDRPAVLAFVVLVAAGCSCDQKYPQPLDGYTGDCTPGSCDTWCRSTGHAGGHCVGDACVCDESDVTTEGWDVTGPTIPVTGVVWSPGQLVPISGALVYFAFSDPPPIPSGAYPETCENPPTPFFTLSNPDGTFTLLVTPGNYSLVVQKGQFRRVRSVTVPETGPWAVPEEMTTLPNENGTGDTIPHMALVWALDNGDHIEDVLAKLEMGDTGSDNMLIVGTEHFDIYNMSPYPSNTALLENLSTMLSYHIIFFPCTINGYPQIGDPTAPLADGAVLGNIRAFLQAGGKIYATDMMYDIFEQALPVYVDVCGDDATINAGDQEAWAHMETMSGWTSHGQSIDPQLSAWLDAIGVGSTGIDILMNFVWIEDVFDIPDPPPTGPQPPKIWVTGDFVLDPTRTLPLTVTFPSGAGKVLFSTYHTVGDPGGYPGHYGIYPQEWILVYLIMEIGVCTDPLI